MVAEAAAQLLEDLAGALDVDLVRHLHRGTEIRAFGALWPPHGIERDIGIATELAGHPLQHLLRHLLGTLTELLERALLGAGRAIEIALAERLLGFLHGALGAAELRGWLHTELLEALAELAETIA